MSGIAAGAILAGSAIAASLRVAPVLVDIAQPGQTATLNVWNDGPAAINVQVRVMRWWQIDGEDVLEPTNDVVVSPPIATLSPGAESVVRIVRVTGAEPSGEESYRLLVDELPDAQGSKPGSVSLVIRHSIPVFFARGSSSANVSWRSSREPGGIRLTAENYGGRRLRVADLKLAAGGAKIAELNGLVGYVLGGSATSWLVPTEGPPPAGTISVTGDSETGRFDAIASPAVR